jgi:hypothetical protein
VGVRGVWGDCVGKGEYELEGVGEGSQMEGV